MFSFFKKKSNLVTDISWLGTDIHNHLLPGIDDGAKDLNESLSYIKSLQELGFAKFICTPHIYTEIYPNTSSTIMSALHVVRDAFEKEAEHVDIHAAAEYMIDDTFRVDNNQILLPGGHILIEMSYLNETPNIEQVIFDLQILGHKVILAHPERYNFYHKNLGRYQRLKAMGCLFQLNLLSVLGYYGKHVELAANYLLEQKLYDFAGTDLHHEKHLMTLQKAVKNGQLYNLIGNYNFRNKDFND